MTRQKAKRFVLKEFFEKTLQYRKNVNNKKTKNRIELKFKMN